MDQEKRVKLLNGTYVLGLVMWGSLAVGSLFVGYSMPDLIAMELLFVTLFFLSVYLLFTPRGRASVRKKPQKKWVDRRTTVLYCIVVAIMFATLFAGNILIDADLWVWLLIVVAVTAVFVGIFKLVILTDSSNRRSKSAGNGMTSEQP